MDHPIRTARESRGLSVDALAELASINERSVRRAEAWESVSADTRAKIAKALGVEVSDLWEPVEIGSVVAGIDGPARIAGMFGGEYVLQPLEFAPPISVSEADLRARYSVEVVAPLARRAAKLPSSPRLAEAARRARAQEWVGLKRGLGGGYVPLLPLPE